MDIVLLFEQLYESKDQHQLSNEDNKNKWINLLNLIKNVQNENELLDQQKIQQVNKQEMEIRQNILQNSNLFLLCQCKEQEDYLLHLQIKLHERGILLKEDLTDQQMIETGLAFLLLLLLEKQITIMHPNNQTSQSQKTTTKSQFKSIHKVLNYDYFMDNNINDHLQRYEEIPNSEKSSQIERSQQDDKYDSLQQYLFSDKNDINNQQPFSQSPLKIQINSQMNASNSFLKENIFSQNLYQNSQIKSNKKQNAKINEGSEKMIFKRDFIFNISILFYRFFESFTKSYEQYSIGLSPNLSHYFLNIISDKKLLVNLNPLQKESTLKTLKDNNLSTNKCSQQQLQCITPLKLSTPDAIRRIENNSEMISNNKENTQENPFTTCFQTSAVQQFDPVNNLFEKQSKNKNQFGRHSIDHTGNKIVDSPQQYKKNMKNKKNERFESCILNGNLQFEDSQMLISKLDLEKRRYQQYCQEQSNQIQELNSLYIDLKNKYESLLQSNLNSISQHQRTSKQPESSIQRQKILLENSNERSSESSIFEQFYTQNNGKKQENQKQEIEDFFHSQKHIKNDLITQSQIIQSSTLCQSESNNIKTSECNPILFQTFPKNKNAFVENDSDINRRQIHNEILSQSFLFQSEKQLQDQVETQLYDGSEEQPIKFNYVSISEFLNNKIRSSFSSNSSTKSETGKIEFTIADTIKLLISLSVIFGIFYYLMYY